MPPLRYIQENVPQMEAEVLSLLAFLPRGSIAEASASSHRNHAPRARFSRTPPAHTISLLLQIQTTRHYETGSWDEHIRLHRGKDHQKISALFQTKVSGKEKTLCGETGHRTHAFAEGLYDYGTRRSRGVRHQALAVLGEEAICIRGDRLRGEGSGNHALLESLIAAERSHRRSRKTKIPI